MITQNEKPPHGRPFLFSITRRILEKIIFQNLIDVNDNLEALAKLIYMNFFFNRTPNGLLSDIIHEYPKSQVQVNEAKCSNGRFPFLQVGMVF